ncbi:MAG: hypothetical protein K0R47_293 [Brevibacillus sp.]|nr:hypothetical protein [Brevibacillus sp.]
MKKIHQAILAVGLLCYLLTPAVAPIWMGTTLTAVEKYRPQDSQSNAQKFLIYILEHIHEGTLGGDIPFNMTKEDLHTNFSITEDEYVSASWNTSYFDRKGYRYFLFRNDGRQYLLVIQAQFEPLTKDQIFAIFGNHPYIDSKTYHQIGYKLGEYTVIFTNTDRKNQDFYDNIMLSPRNPFNE